MSKNIFEREYHKTRLARRNLTQNIQPFFGLGTGRMWNRNKPRLEKVPVRSPIFETEDEAREWAQLHPLGTNYVVHPYYGSLAISWENVQELLTGGRKRDRKGWKAALYTRVGAPFRTQSVDWGLEDEIAAEELVAMKKRRERHGFQGLPKSYRPKYHRQRRQAGNKAARLAMQGDLDGAEDVNLHVGETGILWDVW